MPNPNQTKTILYCTDFSQNADLAFDYTLEVARHLEDPQIILLHVIPELDSQFWRTYIYEADINIDEKAKNDLDAKIDNTYRHRFPAGIAFRPEFRIGRADQEILKFASENHVDLIIIGRQGRDSFRNLFFGSVAERVAGRAECPVIVVPFPKESKK